jgi:hypothetical protein
MCEERMKDLDEITILREGNVKITSQRVIIGTRVYALSNMASVRMHVNEPTLFLPVFYLLIAAICSALVAVSDMDDYSHFLTNGLYLAIAGFLFFLLSRKTKYSVRARSSAGEIVILEASDRDCVERIIRAMNEALSLQA